MIPSNQIWWGSGSGGVTVLQDWYDSLIVKPSEGLWTDLKIMADGMDEDGDWDEIDLFGMVAAMETDEQRLRPLKTTSGDDCVAEGTPNLSINGVDDPSFSGNSGINLKWNPSVNGVKFTLNSAYVSSFGITKSSDIQSEVSFGATNDLSGTNCVIYIDSSTTTINMFFPSTLNTSLTTATFTKTLLNANKNFNLGLKRTNSTDIIQYVNNTSNSLTGKTSNSIVNMELGLLGMYFDDGILAFIGTSFDSYYSRGCIAGSSLIDHDRVAARLNTFFAARGLSIANY